MELSAQERIKIAASKVFTLKGLEGARMQDIADEAVINKAMLHYYFKNKETLFQVIFKEKVTKIFGAFHTFIDANIPFDDKIRKFVASEIEIISEFPVMPLFVLLEIRKNPELILNTLKEFPLQNMMFHFGDIIDKEVLAGNIRFVRIDELMLNIMSLCVYPIIAQPIFSHILDINEVDYKEILEKRKKIVADLIINDLKIK